jgi:DNA excision repair protein ERCC-4
MKWMCPSDPLNLTILIDTREQRPFAFGQIPTQRVTLSTGDYSVIANGKDLRDVVAIERKSASDLLNCVGGQRERFERELCRLAELPYRALVIEAPMNELTEDARHSNLEPKQIMGSVLAWTFKYGVAPIFCSGRPFAAAAVRMLLYHGARYAVAGRATPMNMFDRALWSELRPLRGALVEIADVMSCGREKHPDGDGFAQSADFHLERARQHLELLAAGDQTEPHLEHATMRLLMTIELTWQRSRP